MGREAAHRLDGAVDDLVARAAASEVPDGAAAAVLWHQRGARASGLLRLDDAAMAAWCRRERDPATLAGLWSQPALPPDARAALVARWAPAALDAAAGGDAGALAVVAALPSARLAAGVHGLAAVRGCTPLAAVAALAVDVPLAVVLARRVPLGLLGPLAAAAAADGAGGSDGAGELDAALAARVRGANLSDDPRRAAALRLDVYRLCGVPAPPRLRRALGAWLARDTPPAPLAGAHRLAGDVLSGALAGREPSACPVPDAGAPRLAEVVSDLLVAGLGPVLASPAGARWAATPALAPELSAAVEDLDGAALAGLGDDVLAALAATVDAAALDRLVDAAAPASVPYARQVLARMHRLRRPPGDRARQVFSQLPDAVLAELVADPAAAHVLLELPCTTVDHAMAAPAEVALARFWDPAALLGAVLAALDHDPSALNVLRSMPGNFLSLGEACHVAVASTAAHQGR